MHVLNDYDYRFKSIRRAEVIEVLKARYKELAGRPLKLYSVKPSNLKDFTTTEKDLKKGISRIPLETNRVKDGDTSASTTTETEPDTNEDYDAQIDSRAKLIEEDFIRSSLKKGERPATDIMESKTRGETIYSRQKTEGE